MTTAIKVSKEVTEIPQSMRAMLDICLDQINDSEDGQTVWRIDFSGREHEDFFAYTFDFVRFDCSIYTSQLDAIGAFGKLAGNGKYFITTKHGKLCVRLSVYVDK